jgi:cytochrome P450
LPKANCGVVHDGKLGACSVPSANYFRMPLHFLQNSIIFISTALLPSVKSSGKMPDTIPVYRGKLPFLPGPGFLRDPYRFTIEQQERMGDFYRMPFLFRNIFVMTNLDGIAHVLQKNQKNYVKSPAYRQLRLALGNGLVTSEGEYWRQQRRLSQPAFYKTQLEDLFRGMTEVAGQYMAELAEKIAEGPNGAGQPLDMAKEMMAVTARIVVRTLFSTNSTADINEMYRIMMEAQDYIVHRTVHPYLIPLTYLDGKHRRFRRDMRWFDAFIYGLIGERRRDPSPPSDLLTMLLSARDEDTGQAMSDLALRDELVTLFAAGHETSATSLSWTLWLLAQHPGIVQRLRNEADEVLAGPGHMPTFEDLRRLPFTTQVIQESMRLYPPGFAIGRQALAPDEVLGTRVPKGSILFISIGALHRDARHWQRPHEFWPEHFGPELERERPRLAYMPFGAGPRMCIGNHFAMMEMQLLLPLLVRQFDFELVPGLPVEPEPLVTLKPKHGILMRVKKRQVPTG